MFEAIITFVHTSQGPDSDPSMQPAYPITEVMRVEFDTMQGFRNLVDDMLTDGAKVRKRYGITSMEDLKAV